MVTFKVFAIWQKKTLAQAIIALLNKLVNSLKTEVTHSMVIGVGIN